MHIEIEIDFVHCNIQRCNISSLSLNIATNNAYSKFSVQTTLKIHKHFSAQTIFETSQENGTSCPTVAMFQMRLRVPHKYNKHDFNRANEIFVCVQLNATEGSMSLFPDNRFDNLL